MLQRPGSSPTGQFLRLPNGAGGGRGRFSFTTACGGFCAESSDRTGGVALDRAWDMGNLIQPGQFVVICRRYVLSQTPSTFSQTLKFGDSFFQGVQLGVQGKNLLPGRGSNERLLSQVQRAGTCLSRIDPLHLFQETPPNWIHGRARDPSLP